MRLMRALFQMFFLACIVTVLYIIICIIIVLSYPPRPLDVCHQPLLTPNAQNHNAQRHQHRLTTTTTTINYARGKCVIALNVVYTETTNPKLDPSALNAEKQLTYLSTQSTRAPPLWKSSKISKTARHMSLNPRRGSTTTSSKIARYVSLNPRGSTTRHNPRGSTTRT